jgi:hypothetical protein
MTVKAATYVASWTLLRSCPPCTDPVLNVIHFRIHCGPCTMPHTIGTRGLRITTLSCPFCTSFLARCSGAHSRLSGPTTTLSCPFCTSSHTPTFNGPFHSAIDLLKLPYCGDEPVSMATSTLHFLIPGYYLNQRTDVSMRNQGMLALSTRTTSFALKTVFRGHLSVATARNSRTMRPAAAVAVPARR